MTEEQKLKLIKLRCKAWGITEDEYYCNQCSDFSLEDMARAYRRGKNKGARDTAIQNGRFYQKQMQDIYDKKNKQIQIDAEQIRALQKQNGELTDELTKKAGTNHQLVEQLAKLEAEVFFLKDSLNHEVELHQHAEEYIKSLEAQIEKMKWHDLRIDSNDLPKDRHNVWIVYLNGYYQEERSVASYRHKFWVISGLKTECEVIAWCELPQF